MSLRSLSLSITLAVFALVTSQQTLDRRYWENSASEDLEESLKINYNTKTAKNVIIFIGDGMGPNTVTATRIFNGGEASYLSWEKFPHVGALKTYAVNKQVPDSASTATAMFTGVKVNYRVLGLDSSVDEGECENSLRDGVRLTTIASLAQQMGKATGIVTTTRVTHATPAAMYAQAASRKWECDSSFPSKSSLCKDIGRQLIEDEPGKNVNVIMGGGRQVLKFNSTGTPIDPLDHLWSCKREDGRDLISEWAQDKKARGLKFAVAGNTKQLLDVDTDNTDYLMGIFANSHLSFDYIRNTSDEGMPSLEKMTTAAIKVLKNNEKGFLLMVEGGLIDQAHHRGRPRKAIYEVLAFNDAINSTMRLLESAGIKDETLVIVTSDHAHTLTISGYPARGNDILGIAMKSKADGVPYTTLGYANSGPDNYHYTANGTNVIREDPSTLNTSSFDYGHQAAVLNDENTHGGSDVFVYATGPYAHLFHCIHEQNYVASVIKYAAKLGEYSASHLSISTSSCPSPSINVSVLLMISLAFLHFS